MVTLARTYNDWREIDYYAPKGSKLRQTAQDNIAGLTQQMKILSHSENHLKP